MAYCAICGGYTAEKPEAAIPCCSRCSESQDDVTLTCPVCGGAAFALGKLGKLTWFRCRDCGMDFSQKS